MNYFPVSWNLAGKPVVIVGGGEVAERRIQTLLECGAELTVITPRASASIRSLAEAGSIRLESRRYQFGDLAAAKVVLAASDDPKVNAEAWREAQNREIPINVADDPPKCDFILPALVRRGNLTVAISTNGRSPALAARLRSRLGGVIGAEYGRLVEVLDEVRSRLKQRSLDTDDRKRILYNLLDSNLLNMIRRGETEAIARQIDEFVQAPAPHPGHAPTEGIVYIVGAGPGDPGLITARGLEHLRAADVVLHDRLIHPDLLRETRPDAEIVNVGKHAGDRKRTQATIHELMVDRARRGQTVCRLKGGDPFVFGRGGEEAQALTEAGVAFQIVPGVTSAVAAPAAAGIPVTHRDIAHSFLVLTGSRAEQGSPEEWEGAASIIAGGGTVVVMMGLSWLERVATRFREAGCPETTPVAVISHGTWEDQQVWVGTLQSVAREAAGMNSPAVIVLGPTVEQRRQWSKLAATRWHF